MYQWGIQVGQWCHPDPAVALPASVEQFCRPFLGFATIGRKNEIGQVVSHGFLTYYTLRQSNMAMKNPWKSMKILQKGRGFIGKLIYGGFSNATMEVNEICFNSPSIFRKSRIHCVLLDVCATWTPGARSFLPGWKANIKRNHAIPSLPSMKPH